MTDSTNICIGQDGPYGDRLDTGTAAVISVASVETAHDPKIPRSSDSVARASPVPS